MRMGSFHTVPAAVVLALLLCGSVLASAQEDCAAIEQARSHLEKELADRNAYISSCQDASSQLTSDLQRSQSELASLKVKQDAEASTWASQVTSLQQQNREIKAQQEAEAATWASKISSLQQETNDAKAKLAEQTASQAKLAELESTNAALIAKCQAELAKLKETHTAQLAELQRQLATKGSVNITELISELASSTVKYVQSSAKCTVDEIKLVVAGLQQGNTKQLSALAQKMSTSVARNAKAGFELASAKFDEHLPFVKQRSAEAWQKGSTLYQKHMGSAAWVAEMQKYVSNVNTELKSFLTTQIKAQPALKSLDDPVFVQLLAYMVIGAPLLLLFLPVLLWLATLAAPASKTPAATTSSKHSKKTKKIAKAPAAKK